MKSHGHKRQPEKWCLFIDANKHSLEAVLLHNGNEYLSIPIAHATIVNDNYTVMKLLLDKISYKSYE